MSESLSKNCFVDTNIWLYAFIETQGIKKSAISKKIIQGNDIVLSSQVINETCVNLIKKARFSEESIRQLIISFYEKYSVLEITETILLKSSKLRESLSISFWDSLIASSALSADVEILYSEDMQHGLVIEDKIEIINPFKL